MTNEQIVVALIIFGVAIVALAFIFKHYKTAKFEEKTKHEAYNNMTKGGDLIDTVLDIAPVYDPVPPVKDDYSIKKQKEKAQKQVEQVIFLTEKEKNGVKICSRCDAENKPENKFCLVCGYRLGGDN